MRHSTDRILTTHAGSLSRPPDLIALGKSIAVGETKSDDPAYARILAAAVADVVRKQRELGVDIPDDGEFGTAGGRTTARGGITPLRACRVFRRREVRRLLRTKPSTRSRVRRYQKAPAALAAPHNRRNAIAVSTS